MDQFIAFAKDASPVTLSLASVLALIYIIFQLLESRGIIKRSSKHSEASTTMNVLELSKLQGIEQQLNKIANNHLHGLPDMEKSLDRIEKKVDKFADDVITLRERVAKLE